MLIVTADDFGVSDGANRAVRDLHKEGVVTSAAIVPVGEAFTEAAAMALTMPRLEIGLHFVLADTRPCSSPDTVSTLLGGDGSFLKREQLALRLLARRVRASDIVAEFDAQLSAVHAAGMKPAFVNGDQHVHTLPVVRDVVVRRAAAEGMALRIPAERFVVLGDDRRRARAQLAALPRFGKKLV